MAATPVQQARKYERQIDGSTANPNATPGAGRGSRNSGSPWGMRPASATPRLDAGVQTPGLDSNPARSTSDAVAESNRNGAFGTGAANLQKRKDLYAKMGADKDWQSNPAYRAEAQSLGVTDKGWANAANSLARFGSMTPAARPATPQVAAAQPAAKPTGIAKAASITPPATLSGNPWSVSPAVRKLAGEPQTVAQAAGFDAPRQPNQNALAVNAPTPEIPPTAPLPGQSAVTSPVAAPIVAATLPTAQPGAMLRPATPMPSWAVSTGTKPSKKPSKPASKAKAPPLTPEERQAAYDADLAKRVSNSPAANALRSTWSYLAGGYQRR